MIFRRSWLGNLNFWIFQWFFVRLVKTIATNLSGKPETTYWMIIGPAWPLTGWWSDYKFIGNLRSQHLLTQRHAELENA